MNGARQLGTAHAQRQAPLAEIAEVARALVGRDFGFLARPGGVLHLAVAPAGETAVPVADVLRVEALLDALTQSADDVVVVAGTASGTAHEALGSPGAGPPIGSFAAVRLRTPGGRVLGYAGGGGVAAEPFAPAVTASLPAFAVLAVGAMASGPEVTSESEAAERQQRERDRTILDALRDCVLMFDASGRIVTSNTALEQLFDVSAGWLAGRSHEEMVAVLERLGGGLYDEDGAPLRLERHPAVVSRETGRTVSDVLMGIRRSWSRPPKWFQVSARPLVSSLAAPPYPVVVSFSDVTEIRNAELERDELVATIARERMFLAAVLGRVGEGIEACDASGRVTVFNEAMWLFLQPAPGDDPIGTPPSVAGLARPDGRPLVPREHPLLLALAGARVIDVELTVTTPNGTRRELLVNGQQLRAPTGEKLGAVVAFHDVTEQKRVESELTDLALHDPLTGLANRILLSDRLEVAFERGVREDTGVGVLMLDLDDFKLVNDTFGHGTGDGVLVAVANRLRSVVRPGDTVARLGGDEFVVVCPLAGAEAELSGVRDRLEDALREPVALTGVEIEVSASIGLALSGPAKSDPETLLRAADESMYRAKEARRQARGSGA